MAIKRNWRDNLQLLADEGTPRKLPSGYTEIERITKKALAAKLGVSTTTLRRWQNGTQEPSKANRAHINRTGARRRTAMIKAGYPDIPRIPYGHRRQLKEYAWGKRTMEWTGKFYESPWINFSVEGWSKSEILTLLESLRGWNNYYQFIFRINSGPDRGHGIHGGTNTLSIDDRTSEQLARTIDDILELYMEYDDDEPNDILWVGVLPNVRKV